MDVVADHHDGGQRTATEAADRFGFDPAVPVSYTYDASQHGADWSSNAWLYQEGRSTWYNINV